MSFNVKRIHYAIVGSTQDEAKKNTDLLMPNMIMAYSASEQTEGKGTQGKSWTSPPDMNLYVTFSFQIDNIQFPLTNLAQVTSFAVAKTLEHYGIHAQLKWINDVLVNGKKIAGIYCEVESRGNTHIVHIGIGLNINMDKSLCVQLDQAVTSMKLECDKPLEINDVYHTLEKEFVRTMEQFFIEGFDFFASQISDLLAFKDEFILFDYNLNGDEKEFISGKIQGIDNKGQLLFKTKDNILQKYFNGRIVRSVKHSIPQINTTPSLKNKTFLPPNGKKFILVYNDLGTIKNSINGSIDSLQSVIDLNHYEIMGVDKHFINEVEWEKHTALFVMPGGRSKPFYQDLSGFEKGNHKIKMFVEKMQGNYLGICAGGYYASETTEFEIGYPLEIRCGGVLNFFKGRASGTLYEQGLFQYENNNGARLANISIVNQSQSILLYYNGGACFISKSRHNQYSTVLGKYDDHHQSPAAIVLCNAGNGKALLTGVHPEYSFREVETQPHPNADIHLTLKKTDQKRLECFAYLLSKLEIKLNSTYKV